jgi:hypothetical protein
MLPAAVRSWPVADHLLSADVLVSNVRLTAIATGVSGGPLTYTKRPVSGQHQGYAWMFYTGETRLWTKKGQPAFLASSGVRVCA